MIGDDSETTRTILRRKKMEDYSVWLEEMYLIRDAFVETPANGNSKNEIRQTEEEDERE